MLIKGYRTVWYGNLFFKKREGEEMEKNSIFGELVSSMSEELGELPEILQKEKEFKEVPKRLAILAEGFAGEWNLQRVNEELLAQDCEILYARSFCEASLIYAFEHGMTYGEWKEFFEESRELLEKRCMGTNLLASGGKITKKQLEEYVFSQSGEELQTELLTQWMEKEIKVTQSAEDYHDFVKNHIEKFSAVRERARYYFCKYLYFYIQDRCEKYYESCEKDEKIRIRYGNTLEKNERGRLQKAALEELSFLKPLTKLRKEADKLKNPMTPEEKKEYLENTALTPGGIFDEFNYFYFGYVSAQWMEILFELYGEFEEWPEDTQVRIAHSLGLCGKNPESAEKKRALERLKKMEQEQRAKENELDEAGERREELKKKMYQRGRSGEDFFREFMVGSRDINRETLLSFLLFIKMRVPLDEDNKITQNRLNRILRNCGFSQLRPDKEFDRFVMNFLRSKEPMELLEEEVEKQVIQGRDFYLYKVYRDSYCHQKEILEYLA